MITTLTTAVVGGTAGRGLHVDTCIALQSPECGHRFDPRVLGGQPRHGVALGSGPG